VKIERKILHHLKIKRMESIQNTTILEWILLDFIIFPVTSLFQPSGNFSVPNVKKVLDRKELIEWKNALEKAINHSMWLSQNANLESGSSILEPINYSQKITFHPSPRTLYLKKSLHSYLTRILSRFQAEYFLKSKQNNKSLWKLDSAKPISRLYEAGVTQLPFRIRNTVPTNYDFGPKMTLPKVWYNPLRSEINGFYHAIYRPIERLFARWKLEPDFADM